MMFSAVHLILLAMLSTTGDGRGSPSPTEGLAESPRTEPAVRGPQAESGRAAKPGVDTGLETPPETPPPTAYDRQQRDRVLNDHDPERTLLGQLARMLVALALVTVLIYAFAKMVLPRMLRLGHIGGGKHVRLVERVQIDGRHALVMVEVGGERTLLLGTGEQGVQVIAELDRPVSVVGSDVGPGDSIGGEGGRGGWRVRFASAMKNVRSRERLAAAVLSQRGSEEPG